MARLQRGAAGVDRRELPLVLGLLALLAVDALVAGAGLSLLALGAIGSVTLPLLWRSGAPRVVLVVVVVGVFACEATLGALTTVVAPVMVATYSVALHSGRLRSVLLATVVVSAAVISLLVPSDEGAGPRDMVLMGALLLLAVATGDAVRARRAYRESAADREREREREQRAEALRMVAEERLRIAREVHDVVAHAMVAINVRAGVAAHVLDQQPEHVRTALQEIKATSGSALTDLRVTLGLLRDGGSEPLDRPTERLSEVAELADPLRAAGVDVGVSVNGLQDGVPSPVGAAAYRIVQEAATNILRHAGARRATISVEVGRDAVEVLVDDDGAALARVEEAAVAAGSGNGLRGMSERVATLGGTLDAGRRSGGGWRVHATLPLA